MRKFYFFILLSWPVILFAQTNGMLTYKDAIALALKNNFDIRIAQNNASIAAIENNYGNAGFLPRVDINSSGAIATNKTKQEFSNGQEVNKSGVVSKNINAGALLSYTLFDGFRMFATKDRLELLEQQGELNFKLQLENTIEAVTLNYYQIVRQEQLIKGILAAMNVSEERIKLAQTKLEIGSGSNVELLQAKLDLNAQKSNLILQRSLLQEYKNNLSQLIQEPTQTVFSVDSSFEFAPLESIDAIREKIASNNRNIQFAKSLLSITETDIKIIRSQSLPRLGITSGYNFGRNQNTAGFALFTQNIGSTFGFNFTWNIFNGFIVKKQLEAANIQQHSNQLNVDRTLTSLYTESSNAYTRWLGDKQALALEEENIKLAEQSLFIMLERMKLGLGNYLETRESQSSYEAAVTRLVTARYNLKESETRLRKITGEFVQ